MLTDIRNAFITVTWSHYVHFVHNMTMTSYMYKAQIAILTRKDMTIRILSHHDCYK